MLVTLLGRVLVAGEETIRTQMCIRDRVHISKLDRKRVEKVEDVVTVGDMIWVKFMEIDEKGRWNLSRKDALIEIEAQQAAAKAAEQQ